MQPVVRAYPLRYRQLEKMMQERGVVVDHSTINRWVSRFLPLLEKVFRRFKRAVADSWRMDETWSVFGLTGSVEEAQRSAGDKAAGIGESGRAEYAPEVKSPTRCFISIWE